MSFLKKLFSKLPQSNNEQSDNIPNTNTEQLLKTKSGDKITPLPNLENSKKYMTDICQSLSETSKNYDANKTIGLIKKYIDQTEKLDRILYSEISNFLFSVESSDNQDDDLGKIITNVDKLLQTSVSSDSLSSDCKSIILKIYVHSQLVVYQIANSKNQISVGIKSTKSDLKNEIKHMEREYISILGIFSGVILAFIGNLVLTTSVLANMKGVSIYRLIAVIILIMMLLLNSLHYMFRFILKINESEERFGDKVFWINILFLLILILVFLGWFVDIGNTDIREFFRRLL
ncbi:hypothetical protein SMU103_07705 [Streptococcus mutans SA38]|uniref:hypothetical protein n=2 Tax=Streptococcus mutans TaxID=1309 RepID=UPI0002B598C0|nr:hypothetical protein [Streptococcus mutans]EMC47661.1 hypothetical protein SMU103_07705 [Streptococcus mutans SA38]